MRATASGISPLCYWRCFIAWTQIISTHPSRSSETIPLKWVHLCHHGLRSQTHTKFWASTLLLKPRGCHTHQSAGPFWHPVDQCFPDPTQTRPLRWYIYSRLIEVVGSTLICISKSINQSIKSSLPHLPPCSYNNSSCRTYAIFMVSFSRQNPSLISVSGRSTSNGRLPLVAG